MKEYRKNQSCNFLEKAKENSTMEDVGYVLVMLANLTEVSKFQRFGLLCKER